MTDSSGPKPKPLWLGATFVVIGLVILLGLGVWQLQRLRWKEDLLAHIDRLQHAAPAPLSSVVSRPAKDLDFVRVNLNCPALERLPTLRLYAVEDGQAGTRLVAACPVGAGSMLVDRGFLSEGQAPSAGATLTAPIVGVLRVPPKANFVTPKNEISGDHWYSRDLPAMAAALHAGPPLPVMLMLESPAPAGGAPRPAALPTEIPNRHLEYALTWFGLAAALAGVYIALLWRRRSN